jgi:hypothetical protein
VFAWNFEELKELHEQQLAPSFPGAEARLRRPE